VTSLERHPGQQIAERQTVDRGAVRPPVGLLLSIGEVKTTARGVEYPSKLDHFRAKEGKVGQYKREVEAFNDTYGPEPKVVSDVWFLSDIVPFVLDVRLLAFSKTGFRGRSLENLAALDPAGFDQKVRDPFTGTAFEFFPKDATEVRPELREAWDGEPVTDTLTGPTDPRIEKLGIKLVCQLEFMLPEVMGVGRVARITTSSRRSTRNLYSGVWDQWSFFGGRLRGVPFRLEVRPYSGQRFVRNGCPLHHHQEFKDFAAHVRSQHAGENVSPYKGYVKFDAYELVLDSALTYGEIRDAIATRRRELGEPDEEQRAVEARVFQQALALPAPPDIDESTREEPVAGPDETVLNRIAALQQEIEQAGGDWQTALRGVYGVEDALALSPDDAVRYAEQLERALPAEEVEGEVVDEPVDTVDDLPEAEAAAPSGETVEDGLTASVPPGPAEEELGAAGPASTDDLAATVIPTGRRKGKTFAQMESLDPRWFDWAVAHPLSFPGQTLFLERLAAYMETREP